MLKRLRDSQYGEEDRSLSPDTHKSDLDSSSGSKSKTFLNLFAFRWMCQNGAEQADFWPALGSWVSFYKWWVKLILLLIHPDLNTQKGSFNLKLFYRSPPSVLQEHDKNTDFTAV